jgi:hypothetical protein
LILDEELDTFDRSSSRLGDSCSSSSHEEIHCAKNVCQKMDSSKIESAMIIPEKVYKSAGFLPLGADIMKKRVKEKELSGVVRKMWRSWALAMAGGQCTLYME